MIPLTRFLPALALLAFFPGTPSPGRETPSRVAIWELKGPGATVYLAGSVHLLREKDLPIPPAFDKVYQLADELVFELDMAEMLDPAQAAEMQKNSLLPEGETLSDHFDAPTMAGIRTMLAETGLPKNIFDRMKPGAAFLSLTSLTATRLKARPDLGLEIHYYRKSVNDGKPLRGLETMAYQIGLFEEINTGTLQRLIGEMIAQQDEAEASLDKIIAAWKSGDPKEIEDIIVAELAAEPEVKEVLLTRRNRNWIPEIEQALRGEKTTLFLVGAAHLAGEDSVIDLLEKKGLSPSQLSAVPAPVR